MVKNVENTPQLSKEKKKMSEKPKPQKTLLFSSVYVTRNGERENRFVYPSRNPVTPGIITIVKYYFF